MDPDSSLRVCTLNCWGLKYVAKDRVARIRAIASALEDSDYDIIALQELWVSADYALVRARLSRRLPHAKYFYSGALGAGLALFSRFPIVGASILPYSLNGSPLDVTGGDWFVGKAAASIVVEHPLLGEVEVFNTHLFAKGGESGPEHHRAHRLVNAWEFAKLARKAAELGRFVICLGDFNSVPTTLPMTIIRDHAQLADAWVATCPAAPAGDAGSFDAREAIARFGVTADSPLNTYSAGKWLDEHAREFLGKRLDYVLFRAPAPSAAQGGARPALRATECRVVLTEHVPGAAFSHSDHFGLAATFAIAPAPDAGAGNAAARGAQDASAPPASALTHASVNTVIDALTTCGRLSRARSREYLGQFGGSVALLLATIVGSAWLPRSWATPVVMLFAAVTTWFGTTMFYVGFVYGRWEVNALQNIIEELEIHKARRTNLI